MYNGSIKKDSNLTIEETIEELADVQEIIDNIISYYDLNQTVIKEAQVKKNKDKGSFKKRIYLEHVE